MAIPPEPIDELMPHVDAAILATVSRILERGPQKPFPQPRLPDEVDLPSEVAYQVIELSVERVLWGTWPQVGTLLQVLKPAGDYALREGNHGPFLLQRPPAQEPKTLPKILGRYGPDTYRLEVIEAAILRRPRPDRA